MGENIGQKNVRTNYFLQNRSNTNILESECCQTCRVRHHKGAFLKHCFWNVQRLREHKCSSSFKTIAVLITQSFFFFLFTFFSVLENTFFFYTIYSEVSPSLFFLIPLNLPCPVYPFPFCLFLGNEQPSRE